MPSPPQTHATTEEPDIVHWHLAGHVAPEDIARIYDVQLAFAEGRTHLFVIVHIHQMKPLSAETRKAVAHGPTSGHHTLPTRGTVVIGASFHIRVLGQLANKAAALLHHTPEEPIRFVDSEQEARTWIAQRRHEIGVAR